MTDALTDWRRLRPSDMRALRKLAETHAGQRELLGRVADIVDKRSGNTVADFEETFLLGVQMRTAWPRQDALGVDAEIRFSHMNEHAIIFMCGFVGRSFDDALEMAEIHQESNWTKDEVVIKGETPPMDFITAHLVTAA